MSRPVAPVPLSPIELALLERFNLEMAEAYDEVAGDPDSGKEARHSAQASASASRARARLFKAAIQALGARPPLSPGHVAESRRPPHVGPERRKRERRIRGRRATDSFAPGSFAPDALDPGARDRRRHEPQRGDAQRR